MPIAMLEIPKERNVDGEEAVRFCDEVMNCVHHVLEVPDKEDKESREVRSNLDKPELRIAFTVGPNEDPKLPGKEAFFPGKARIEWLGQSVLAMVRDSQFDVSEVIVEAWKNTTFLLREGDVSEPVAPLSVEEIEKVGSQISNPKVRLFLSPTKWSEGRPLKESEGVNTEKVFLGVAEGISRRFSDILRLPEQAIRAEVVLALEASTNVALEFDCEINPGTLIPEEWRRYMAESALQILDSSQSTKEGSGEVWIRQG